MDHRVKIKESKKRDKYLDLAWELKNIRNMKVIVMPVVVGALGTIPKGLVKELEDLEIKEVETIQTTALRLARGEDSWRLEETCYHSNSSGKPSVNADVKNS